MVLAFLIYRVSQNVFLKLNRHEMKTIKHRHFCFFAYWSTNIAVLFDMRYFVFLTSGQSVIISNVTVGKNARNLTFLTSKTRSDHRRQSSNIGMWGIYGKLKPPWVQNRKLNSILTNIVKVMAPSRMADYVPFKGFHRSVVSWHIPVYSYIHYTVSFFSNSEM